MTLRSTLSDDNTRRRRRRPRPDDRAPHQGANVLTAASAPSSCGFASTPGAFIMHGGQSGSRDQETGRTGDLPGRQQPRSGSRRHWRPVRRQQRSGSRAPATGAAAAETSDPVALVTGARGGSRDQAPGSTGDRSGGIGVGSGRDYGLNHGKDHRVGCCCAAASVCILVRGERGFSVCGFDTGRREQEDMDDGLMAVDDGEERTALGRTIYRNAASSCSIVWKNPACTQQCWELRWSTD